jgi:alpha-L-rhamnosidase
MHGLIVSDWSKDDKVLVWEIMIPANTEAEIHFPAPKNQVFEGASPASKADGVKFLRMEKDRSVFKVGSGTYRFRFSI